MPTKRIRSVYCSTDSARLVATVPTEPPVSLYCNRNKKYFTVCDDTFKLLDECDASLFIKMYFGYNSMLYRNEFETTRPKHVIQIGTRIYDPNKATFVAKADKCELYRKRTGEYFLYDMQTENIQPMDYDEASEWSRDHLKTTQHLAEFGPIENDNDLTLIRVRISKSAYKKLLREMSQSGKTMERVIRDLLDIL